MRKNTYNSLLNPVNRRVSFVARRQSMLNVIDLQDAQLLERQSRKTLSKFPVGRPNTLATRSRNLSVIHPLILQHLRRTNNSNTRRVASLESRHQRKLLPRSKQVLRINSISLLLGVVAVRRIRGTNDWRQEGTGAENMADGVRDGEDGVFDLEDGLEAGAHVLGDVEDEDIVRFGG